MSQENLADIALLIYACIAYTIAWESLGLKGVFLISITRIHEC